MYLSVPFVKPDSDLALCPANPTIPLFTPFLVLWADPFTLSKSQSMPYFTFALALGQFKKIFIF
jgi:hypothetical protein